MNNTNYKKMLYDELIREYNIYKEQLKSDIITYYGKFYFIITTRKHKFIITKSPKVFTLGGFKY